MKEMTEIAKSGSLFVNLDKSLSIFCHTRPQFLVVIVPHEVF